MNDTERTIERLVSSGRAFVGNPALYCEVMEACHDVGVAVRIESGAGDGFWIVMEDQ